MPLGEGQRLPVWQVSERDRPAARRHRLAEPSPVRVPGHPVEDHPREVELRIEGFEAQHHRARAPRHRPGVGDQDHRRAEPLRDLGRRALVALGPPPVEAAHHTLDEREIGVRRVLRHGGAHVIARAHPAVQAVGRTPRHEGVEAGIDEVGADLEGLHLETAAAQRLEQAEGDRGLAHAAPHPRDDERRNHDRPRMVRQPPMTRIALLTPERKRQIVRRNDGTTRASPRRPVRSARVPGRFPDSRIILLTAVFPAPLVGHQWPRTAFVPDHSEGVVADSHCLPSSLLDGAHRGPHQLRRTITSTQERVKAGIARCSPESRPGRNPQGENDAVLRTRLVTLVVRRRRLVGPRIPRRRAGSGSRRRPAAGRAEA